MNNRKLIPVAALTVLILTGYTSCLKSKGGYPVEGAMEKIAGEWTNTEYDRTGKHPARRVIDLQGNITIYDKSYNDSGEKTGTIKITKAWMDTEGWLWFTDEIRFDDGTSFYELSKLDLQKMDWSLLWSEENFPEKWDAVEYSSCFYRK